MSKRRQLTAVERGKCERKMRAWLHESKRWAKDFEEAVPPIREYGEAYNEGKPTPNAEKMILCATYFLFTAGAVYYHALELAQTKMGHKEADRWFEERRDERKVLGQLYAMRNLLNHGALRDSEDQEFTFLMTKGPEMSISEMMEKAAANPGVSIGVGLSLDLEWWDRKTDTKQDVLKWQPAVLTELEELVEKVT